MKKATQETVHALRERGYRITNARVRVIEGLATTHQPVSIQDLSERVDVDEASVYRTVETLKQEQLLETILLSDGRAKYALAHTHHHHLVCNNCELVVHVPCNQHVKAPHTIEFPTVTSHEVTFYGLCANCS